MPNSSPRGGGSSNDARERLVALLPWLRRHSRALLRDHHLAEDLAQEALLAALRAPPDDWGRSRTWLGRVMRNLFYLRLRRDASRLAHERCHATEQVVPAASDPVERREMALFVRAALERVPEPYGRMVRLRHLDGMTPHEISVSTGLPPGTVRSRLSRGLALLRIELETGVSDGEGHGWLAAFSLLGPSREGPRTRLLTTSPAWLLALAASFVVVAGVAWLCIGPRAGDSGATVAVGLDGTPGALPFDARHVPARRVLDVGPARGRVRGRIVDEETNAPVAGLDVHLRTHDAVEEHVQSDADGRFVSSDIYAAGPIQLTYGFCPDYQRSFERVHQPGAELSAMPAAMGPAFRIELESDELEPQGYRCMLLCASIAHGIHTERDMRFFRSYEVVLEQGIGSVRFSSDYTTSLLGLELSTGWHLAVRSHDGLAWGAATIAGTRSAKTKPLGIRVQPSARIEGAVADPNGGDLSHASVSLHWDPPVARRFVQSGQMRQSLDASGGFRFDALEPGEYVVRVESPRHLTEHVRVAAQGVTSTQIRLVARPRAGDLVGSCLLADGDPAHPTSIHIAHVEEPEIRFTAAVEWDDSAAPRSGSFAVADVPPGTYELRAQTYGTLRWQQPLIVAAPGAGPYVFRTVAPPLRSDLIVDVVDELGHVADEYLRLLFRFEDGAGWELIEDVRSGQPFVEDFPSDVPFEWSLRAPGRRPFYGTHGVFRPTAAGVERTTVRLEQGWGVQLRVRGCSCADPMPGLLVYADDLLVAVTDAAGRATVETPVRPSVLRVQSCEEAGESKSIFLDGSFLDRSWWVIDVCLDAARR